MSASNGGPAFPIPSDGVLHGGWDGMSMRQYYKAHALVALCSTAGGPCFNSNDTAWILNSVCKMADAMLAEDAEFAAKSD